MVVDLSCARALGTALESEGRSKPTRQDSETGRACRFPRRLFVYCSYCLETEATKVSKKKDFIQEKPEDSREFKINSISLK